MKLILTIVTLLFVSSVSLAADDSDKFARQVRKEFKLETYKSGDLNDPAFKIQTATIFSILANTSEVNIHQMNGEIGNKAFLHEDGHREAVFDINGNAVTECPNKATYNYYHPFEKPLGHFTADTLPWLLLGSCRDDETTREQRIDAYMLDFRDGFNKVMANGSEFYLPNEFSFGEYGQSEAVSFFLKVLDTSGFDLNRFVPGNVKSPEHQEQFFQAVESGLKSLLKK